MSPKEKAVIKGLYGKKISLYTVQLCIERGKPGY